MSAAEQLDLASALEVRREGDGLRLRFVGQWTTQELARHDARLRSLDLEGAREAAVDLSDCTACHGDSGYQLPLTGSVLGTSSQTRFI